MSAAPTYDAPEPDIETAVATLDVVIPVFNEEADLATSVERVVAHLRTLPWSFRVTIADNASTDGSAVIAHRLQHAYDEVHVVHLAEKGRGRALRRAWTGSASPVLVYMDVDLSTDLNALMPLVAPLLSGHSDLAIGSRLRHDSRVSRGPRRELISRGYNLLVRGTLRTRFSDAQCGFKAIRADVAREVLPLVEDNDGSSTPSCWSWRSGRVFASTRCRWTGSMTRTVASTSCAPRWTTCAASPGSAATWCAAGSRCRRCPSGSAGRVPTPGAAGWACRW